MAFLLPLGRGSSVAIGTSARKSFPRSASQFLCTVPDLPGTRSTQAGRGMILPASGRDAGELVGPVGVGLGGATRLSSTLGTRTPAKRAGFRCGLQARLDMGPHGVPRGCQCRANPAMVAASKRNCRIARTPRRVRGARTFSSCSRNAPSGRWFRGISSAVLCHRILAGPWPKARRSPPPPRARDLERFTP